MLTKGVNGVHAKFVGTPIVGSKEKAIWVPKSLVANCHGVKTMASMLFESVSEYGVSDGLGGLRDTRITQRRHNGLSSFGLIPSLCPSYDDPNTQEHPKSRGYNRV